MTCVYSVAEPEVFVFICVKVIAAHTFPHRLNRINIWLCLYIIFHVFLC